VNRESCTDNSGSGRCMYRESCIRIHDSRVCRDHESCIYYDCIVDQCSCDDRIKIHDSSDYINDSVSSDYNGGRGYFRFTKYSGCDDYAAALLTVIYPVLILDSFPSEP
jgi:hypothetical protein